MWRAWVRQVVAYVLHVLTRPLARLERVTARLAGYVVAGALTALLGGHVEDAKVECEALTYT